MPLYNPSSALLGGATIYVAQPAGATATDTPNVETAITAFVNALSSGPVTLMFADGTYQIDSNSAVIRSVSNFTVKSTGATVISQAPNRSGLVSNVTGDVFVIADCTDFTVDKSITFDGMRDEVAPLTVLSANASSGQPSVTVASGSGARYIAGQRLSVFGGLYANGGTQSTNTLGADANKQDANLTISSITTGGGSGGGDLITFTSNLSNTYTAAAGTLSDGFGPFAAAGAYVTPYQTATGNSVAGRTGLGGEDQQNGLHLMNCQRFSISATARNVWESPIKLGTGFGNNPLGDGCSDGDVTRATCYHGYDQGVSVWVSQRITVEDSTLNATGWAGISFTHSDKCTAEGNRIYAQVYRPPGDTNSGSGVAVEGGDGCVIKGNQIISPWRNAIVPRVSPLSFGVNTGSPPTLSAQVAAGTAAGTSVQVSSSAAFTLNATYCLMDAERTEKIGIASIVDGTHVKFDRITRFTHASGVAINAAVATDTLIEGNNCRDTQVGSLAEIESSARTILKGNDLIGSAVLSGLASPFSFGVNCSQTSLGASTLGGEGAVIEGNVIGRTSNEGIYVNNTNQVTIRGNTIGPSSGGSTLIHETGTSDYNRIEGNILDSQATAAISWAGAHTVVRRNSGKYPSQFDLAVAADSPSMWWTLGDAAGTSTEPDNSGNSHTGTVSNVTFAVPGPLTENSTETAGQFVSGSPSIITSSYQVGSQTALTVELWLNAQGISQPSGSARVVCNSHTDADHNGFQIQAITSGGILYAHINMGNGSATTDIGATIPMPSTGWMHLVGTYGGTTLLLYQNGFQVASGSLTGPVTAGSATGVAAGGNPVYNGDYFSGLIAHVIVYAGTTLSAARVQAHYKAGAYA